MSLTLVVFGITAIVILTAISAFFSSSELAYNPTGPITDHDDVPMTPPPPTKE